MGNFFNSQRDDGVLGEDVGRMVQKFGSCPQLCSTEAV